MVAAIYRHENQAIRVVEHLIRNDFLPDRISLLGRRFSKGDDLLGIYHPSPKERMKKWARWGIAIGAIWGLLSTIISSIASLETLEQQANLNLFETALWTTAYSALVGGIMAAAAAFSQIATMLHRMGIPQEQLQQLEAAIKAEKYVIVLIGSRRELEPFYHSIEYSGAELFLKFIREGLEV